MPTKSALKMTNQARRTGRPKQGEVRPKLITLNLRLTEAQREQLQALADGEDRTMTALILRALRNTYPDLDV
jgi:Fe2+ or Zn2+ uptake regulation protein